MIHIIVGTAGHIDHGKTTLVRALTGIDTDRLEEEKRRGISIDLGFAHLEHDGVLFGFVDVPGHERFVKNMLAGVGGIDVVLLVVSADESVKPQTREHFEICKLLGLRHGIVALTKIDAADEDQIELAKLEIAELTEGSFLESAPVVELSAATGAGLQTLKERLREAAARVEPRPAGAPARLPIDRSFSLRGFGTVVTGTLWSGRLRVEEEVELLPGGRRLRIRGLQVHGGPVSVASPGQRTAVNLAGVEASELRRGMMLAHPGLYDSTPAIDCEFDLLAGALPLKHRAPIHFHAGAAEVEAEVRLLEGPDPLQPGRRAFLRILLREPLPLLPSDRFIARMFSPVLTIGGGRVIENHPPVKLRKQALLARLKALRDASPAQRLALLAGETHAGLPLAEIPRRCGLRVDPAGAGLVVVQGYAISPAMLAGHASALAETLARYHREHPLHPGMPRASAPTPPHLLDTILGDPAAGIIAEGEILRLATHRVRLKGEEDAALARMEELFRAGGLAVPSQNEVIAQAGIDPGRARLLLQVLLKQQRLVRISPDLLYHTEAVTQLRQTLAGRKGKQFAVGDFKDWTGVSRKYAIPLLEWLDRERITRREGDRRVVL